MMERVLTFVAVLFLLQSCNRSDSVDPETFINPEIELAIPEGFPSFNPAMSRNKPTKYGVELGEALFNEKRFSIDNSISCASCHVRSMAFSDSNAQAVGVFGRVGIRNTPPIQNLAFLAFYNWDGMFRVLENQPLIPVITHEEMNSSIMEVIEKIQYDTRYKELFRKSFGDDRVTPGRIFKSISQFEYTLISADSKYDRVKRKEGEVFSLQEERGYLVFQQKCSTCHSGELFTDQSFRNVGFPVNNNSNEGGRARVTGILSDYMSFRVPSLRNAEYTAPYGSFGQFATLKEVLDYFDDGVLHADNLDPVLKNNENKIPMTEGEKEDIIAFIKTLSDKTFVGK